MLNTLGYFDGQSMDKMGRIKIGNNCFLGAESVVLGGVTIGDNVIIGTRSVVTKDIPSGYVVAGVPARVICTIDDYYRNNKDRQVFFPTATMISDQKKKYLIEHVPKLHNA